MKMNPVDITDDKPKDDVPAVADVLPKTDAEAKNDQIIERVASINLDDQVDHTATEKDEPTIVETILIGEMSKKIEEPDTKEKLIGVPEMLASAEVSKKTTVEAVDSSKKDLEKMNMEKDQAPADK